MTSDKRSPDEIERDIERERAELRTALEEIQDRFSVEGVMRQVGDQFREHGGDFSRSVARSVRDNPVALTLTGIGLAWMIFGGRNAHDGADQVSYSARDRADPSPVRSTSIPARPDAGGRRFSPGYRAAPAYAARRQDLPDWARDLDYDEADDGRSLGETVSAAGDRVGTAASDAADTARSAAARARDGAAGAVSSARQGAQKAGESVGEAWESTKSGLSDTADAARRRAAALSARISRGTETLGEEARKRVIAARENAVAARIEAERAMRHGADRAADFYDRNPLVVGALALAAGAALAGALPRTRFEDETMGEYSDRMFDEAERIYEEERAKAEKVVQAGVDEAKRVAEEAKRDADEAAPGDKSAVEAVADKARSASQRVADAAKSKARDEDLGKPDS